MNSPIKMFYADLLKYDFKILEAHYEKGIVTITQYISSMMHMRYTFWNDGATFEICRKHDQEFALKSIFVLYINLLKFGFKIANKEQIDHRTTLEITHPYLGNAMYEFNPDYFKMEWFDDDWHTTFVPVDWNLNAK